MPLLQMAMASRFLALAAALLLLAAAQGGAAGEAPGRPNIVVVLVDDQRTGMLGCEGHPFSQTPEIDSVARAGAIIENAYVTTPLCSPARATFLTGLYVQKHGIRGNGPNGPLSRELITFPRVLHDSGYETAFVGKWHMGLDPEPRPGFDRWVSFRGQGVYTDPTLNVDGRSEARAGYITDIVSAEAAAFIRKPRTKPFCLYLSHKSMHGPFTPAPRHENLYSDSPIVRGPGAADDLKDKPALTREVDGAPAVSAGGGSGDGLIRNQLRCLKSIDEGVGQVLQALRDSGDWKNTLVIYTSDNGYFWGEHGLGDKRWAFEESVRVPMIVQWPAVLRAGSRIRQPILNVDLAPSLLAAAGAAAPAPCHGRSFLPLLQGREVPWRDSFLMEYFAETRFRRTPDWQAVRMGDWKLVAYTSLQNMDELYNLAQDPHELKNRIKDAEAAPALAACRAELQKLLQGLR